VQLNKLIKWVAAFACAGLILAACASTTSTTGKIPTGGTKVSGGVVTWAEPPSATPNYIFPFMTSQYSTVDNISQFQYLLYRPLYMFGSPDSNSPTLDTALSLAPAPMYNSAGTQAVINLSNYKWSDGEAVTADDVLFFMNLMHAEKANWYSYVPGLFPDNVTGVTVNSPTQITFTLNRSYASNWMTYNEFAQITPFPQAWDVTAVGNKSGSGGCSTGSYGAGATDTACKAVYTFLTGQATNISGYATSPIWGVVDGPFKLQSMDSSGDVTMVPNTSYSGPQKATISQFQEVPYTTDDAEFDALVGGKVDVGYLPQQDLTASTSNASVAGPNNPRLTNYYLTPWILFGYNYSVYKLISSGDNGAAGAIFSQLYFRQAMQELVDQPLYISKLVKGYAVPTYGPVPVLPANPYVDSYEETNPYPYNPSKAEATLRANGWKVVLNGTDTCTNPGTGAGQCGAGIPAGTPLSFSFGYATGVTPIVDIAEAEVASWDSAGIHVTPVPATFDTTVGNYSPPCMSASTCSLEIGWWGGGWEYSPDYEPTGELLFQTGAGSNSQNYSNPTMDSLIAQTNYSNVSLNSYENYAAQQLPGVIWQPNLDYSLTEVVNDLRGIAPQNPFANLFPEYWYYVK
jgi:peptide/nickel transport system substrate-binding protein